MTTDGSNKEEHQMGPSVDARAFSASDYSTSGAVHDVEAGEVPSDYSAVESNDAFSASGCEMQFVGLPCNAIVQVPEFMENTR
jgi:hypothetical protein